MSILQMAAIAGNGAAQIYVDDVFSAYTYTGNGATQTITNGIDLAGEGGMVWIKKRDTGVDHVLQDTDRGTSVRLTTNTTNGNVSDSTCITSFNNNGFSLGSTLNSNLATYASWTFRNAPKFFDVQTVTKSAGSNATVSFAGLSTIGMVIVKCTGTTSNWYVWHRSLTAGKLLYLELTDAANTDGAITVSGTTVTLVNGLVSNSTFVVYAFAHDTSADGIIQCGSFTVDGSGIGQTVNLGWEPQFVMRKASSTLSPWVIFDSMRGMPVGGTDAQLYPNLNSAEATNNSIEINATGFSTRDMDANSTQIYLAIRRPNKPPTSGTQVYNAIARTGTGAAATVTGVGFAPDVWWAESRGTFDAIRYNADRLRGSPSVYLQTSSTAAEATNTPAHTWGMDGVNLAGGNYSPNFGTGTTETYINHFFRRAPGVMAQICYTGTGSNKTESHGLEAIPELWLVKGRSGTTEWVWGSSLLANTQKIVMPSPNGVVTDATAWNSTYPTASVISLGTAAAVNTNTATYSCWMWATKAGVSKVFTYTGDGGSGKVINCGFTAGARFILIIRTTASTAQDIFVWDSARGIIAGNDPHLSLNTTAAEVTTDDSVDPDNSGFAINQVAATNINVNGAVYIGVAYA